MGRSLFTNAMFMTITIGVIIGFQVYWLKDNWDREKKAMTIKANLAFQETVSQLQTAKLKLPDLLLEDTAYRSQTRIYLDENTGDTNSIPRRKIVALVNTLHKKMQGDKKDSGFGSTMVFKINSKRPLLNGSIPVRIKKMIDSSNHFLNALYRVDSLQDSIRVSEIDASYAGVLKKENLDVEYKILRLPGHRGGSETDMSRAMVGFAKPVTFQLLLTDTGGYLFKKISLPILFSFLLVGITISSFLILYRNLLRQRRLTEMKNEFISNVSHELKTPIATVGVAIEALKSFHALDDAQKTREYLDISSSELQRLGLLVDKVLKLSLFEQQQPRLNKEPFDLKELTVQVLDAMKPQFEKEGAVVSFTPEGDDFIIQADKLHLTSVIYNLVDNALKYSTDEPCIHIALARQRDVFRLTVSDNGIGIAKEYKSKVFDKFFRVPTGNRHMVKGYGLGLSYVSEIVKRHMGYVEVHSEPGRGSSFIVRIPVEEKDIIWFDDKRSVRKKLIPLPAIKRS